MSLEIMHLLIFLIRTRVGMREDIGVGLGARVTINGSEWMSYHP